MSRLSSFVSAFVIIFSFIWLMPKAANGAAMEQPNPVEGGIGQATIIDNRGDEVKPIQLMQTMLLSVTILSPIEGKPAFAGQPASPQKIIIHLNKPENGLTSDKFAVSVGGGGTSGTMTALPATIITRYEGDDEYVLEVMPPPQPTEGLYNLNVVVTTSLGPSLDVEKDAVYYAAANNADVMLVIDRSGSMGEQNKIQDAKSAANLFIDNLKDDDQVGVASFNQQATLDFGLTTVNSSVKTQAQNVVNALVADGFTSIGGGLAVGQNELVSKGALLHPWAIVLLSDGLQNRAPFVEDVLPGIQTTKTVIHTIAFGSDADEVLMQEIAAKTGGSYNFSPVGQGQILAGIYNTIAGAVSGQQTLVLFNGLVQSGVTDERQIVIDSTVEQATFSISWSNSGSTLGLTLEDPNGTLIDPSTAASNPDVDFVSGPTYAYYRIKSPTLIPGPWKMKVSNGTINRAEAGMTAAADEEAYTAQVTGQTNLNLRAYFYKSSYQANEAIKISVTLSDDQPIQDAQILAVVGPLIQVSAPKAEAHPFVYLYDDGGHGDGFANDGVYANTLEDSVTDTDGNYSFSVFANGTANNGQTFARQVQRSLFVGVDNTVTPFEGEMPNTIYLPLLAR